MAATEDLVTRSPTNGQVRVALVGPPPPWLGHDEASAALTGFDVGVERSSSVHVFHVDAAAVALVPRLRRSCPGARIVADLTANPLPVPRGDLRSLVAADVVAVGSTLDLRELRRRRPDLTDRTVLAGRPLDLERFVPRSVLLERRQREFRKLERSHRMKGGEVVLFAGPYTSAGGLDLAIEAVVELRRTRETARLVALPLGEVDQAFLDRCERDALALGHRGLVEWRLDEEELPLWFGMARVVCLPARHDVDPWPALLAAAAGVPVVGAEIEPLLEVVDEGQTGYVVPVEDATALVSALEAVLSAPDQAARMGATARSEAERRRSVGAAARRLGQVWEQALATRPAPGTAAPGA